MRCVACLVPLQHRRRHRPRRILVLRCFVLDRQRARQRAGLHGVVRLGRVVFQSPRDLGGLVRLCRCVLMQRRVRRRSLRCVACLAPVRDRRRHRPRRIRVLRCFVMDRQCVQPRRVRLVDFLQGLTRCIVHLGIPMRIGCLHQGQCLRKHGFALTAVGQFVHQESHDLLGDVLSVFRLIHPYPRLRSISNSATPASKMHS